MNKDEQLKSIIGKVDKLFDSIRFAKTIKAVYETLKSGETLNDILFTIDEAKLTPKDKAEMYNQALITGDALKQNPDISCNDLVNLLVQ